MSATFNAQPLGVTPAALTVTRPAVAAVGASAPSSAVGAAAAVSGHETSHHAGRTLSATGDATGTSTSFDGTTNYSIDLALATVNTGPVTDAFRRVTTTAKGLVTATLPVGSGDIAAAVGSGAQRLVYATPTESSGVPALRALTAADVPVLNQSTTGSAATLTTARTLSITGDLTWTSPAFNGATNVTAAGTLASVSTARTSGFWKFSHDAKGRVTASTPVVSADVSALVDSRYLQLTGGSLSGPVSSTSGTGWQFSAAAGTTRQVVWQSATSARWSMGTTATAESGSNVGSDFFINSFTDAGTGLASPFSIARATGVTTLLGTRASSVAVNVSTPAAGPPRLDVSGNAAVGSAGATEPVLFLYGGGGTGDAYIESAQRNNAAKRNLRIQPFGGGVVVGSDVAAGSILDVYGASRFFGSLALSGRLKTTLETPASSTAPGSAGEVVADSNFIYVCVAANSWKRVALSTW